MKIIFLLTESLKIHVKINYEYYKKIINKLLR
jgi:hypothetical protein